jgi:hypothetical protein
MQLIYVLRREPQFSLTKSFACPDFPHIPQWKWDIQCDSFASRRKRFRTIEYVK